MAKTARLGPRKLDHMDHFLKAVKGIPLASVKKVLKDMFPTSVFFETNKTDLAIRCATGKMSKGGTMEGQRMQRLSLAELSQKCIESIHPSPVGTTQDEPVKAHLGVAQMKTPSRSDLTQTLISQINVSQCPPIPVDVDMVALVKTGKEESPTKGAVAGVQESILPKKFDPEGFQWIAWGRVMKITDLSRDDLLQIACECMTVMERQEALQVSMAALTRQWQKGEIFQRPQKAKR